MKTTHTLLLALALVASLAACKKDQPAPAASAPPIDAATPATTPAATPAAATVTVSKIDLGSAVGTDMTVAAPATLFKSSDTIYAAVSTAGSGANVALKARWLDQNGNVNYQSTQILNPAGPTVTDFSIPVGNRLKEGKYKVEVFVDNKSSGSMEFSVAK